MFHYLLHKTLFTLTAVVLCASCIFAQQGRQDSLLHIVDTSSVDSIRVEALVEVADELIFNHPDSALHFVDRALEISKSSGYQRGIAKSHNFYGIKNVLKGDNLKGLEHFQTAEAIYQRHGMMKGAAQTINNIGVIYNKLDNPRKAIEQYIIACEINKRLGNYKGEGTGLYNVASNYAEVESYDTALLYLDTLEVLRARHSDINATFDLRAEIFNQQGRLDSAEYYYKRALKEGLREKDVSHESDILQSLAEIQIDLGKYSEAIRNLNKSKIISDENHFLEDIRDYYDLSARIFAAQGNFEEAFQMQDKFVQLKDSLIKVNNAVQINELNTRYQTAKKDREIADNKRLMAEQSAREEMRIILFVIIITSVVIVAVISISFLFKQKKSNKLLNSQNEEISKQRHKIISSINYAKKIQNSILMPEQQIRKLLPASFVYFRPKDIVSGDFYWFSEQGDKIIISAIDCTGHGVPGAFMSLIANAKLNKVINELKISDPSEILTKLHEEIVTSLQQKNEEENAQDGMDMSICVIDKTRSTIEFAGAHNSMMVMSGDNIKEIKADNISIGGRFFDEGNFSSKTIKFKSGDRVYLYTDGYIDQFGGENNKKLNKKKFKSLLTETHRLDPERTKARLDDFLATWKGQNAQLDDILIIGAQL